MQFYTLPNSDKNHFEKAVLILFKFPSRWNAHILRKLSIKFNVYWSFINEPFQQLGSEEYASEILKFSSQQDITSILLDIEFFPCFHISVIDLLRAGKAKLGLIVFDDGPLHLTNRILASRVDFIWTACPISNLKYQEMGMIAMWSPLESDSLYFRQPTEKKTDVLFFGNTTCADRPDYISSLKKIKGLSIIIFDPAIDGFLDQTNFAQMLSSAKIIINLSKSDIYIDSFFTSRPSNFVYQLKGRIAETLFSGAISISEYAPHHHLLNFNIHLNEFKNPNEMIDRIQSFEYSDSVVKSKISDFQNECWSKFCDLSSMNNLDQIFMDINIPKVHNFTHNKSLIDDRYFFNTINVIEKYFSHNTSLYLRELALLNKYE